MYFIQYHCNVSQWTSVQCISLNATLQSGFPNVSGHLNCSAMCRGIQITDRCRRVMKNNSLLIWHFINFSSQNSIYRRRKLTIKDAIHSNISFTLYSSTYPIKIFFPIFIFNATKFQQISCFLFPMYEHASPRIHYQCGISRLQLYFHFYEFFFTAPIHHGRAFSPVFIIKCSIDHFNNKKGGYIYIHENNKKYGGMKILHPL